MDAGAAPRGGDEGEQPGDRVLTYANALSALRLGATPVFAVLVVRDHGADREVAAYLLAALGATDWVDGQLARRLHQVSSLGKVLDPLADRLLLVTSALTTVAVGALPVWVAVVAIAREVAVGAGFVYVAAAGGRRADVSLLGKAATFALMVAVPLFVLGHSRAAWRQGSEDLAWVAVAPALALGWLSAARYVPVARDLLGGARRERGLVS